MQAKLLNAYCGAAVLAMTLIAASTAFAGADGGGKKPPYPHTNQDNLPPPKPPRAHTNQDAIRGIDWMDLRPDTDDIRWYELLKKRERLGDLPPNGSGGTLGAGGGTLGAGGGSRDDPWSPFAPMRFGMANATLTPRGELMDLIIHGPWTAPVDLTTLTDPGQTLVLSPLAMPIPLAGTLAQPEAWRLLDLPAAASFVSAPATAPSPLAPIPSPGALALLGLGALTMLGRHRRG